MLDWLIIGGGIHGTFISHALTAAGGVRRAAIRVIDPWDEPLYLWRRHTGKCGMVFLRSPSSHNLDLDFRALRRYARVAGVGAEHFVEPYARPSLELFQRHAAHVLAEFSLADLRVTGRARRVVRIRNGARVETDAGAIDARNVILAVSMNEAASYPEWWNGTDRRFSHVFDVNRDAGPLSGTVLIVGGGITAAQKALESAAAGLKVIVVSRHDVRESRFDSDPCYIGPKCRRFFLSVRDPVERRRIISSARYPGTIPPDVLNAFRSAVARGRIVLKVGDIIRASSDDSTRTVNLSVVARDSTGPDIVTGDHVVLATGFKAGPPASELVAMIARDFGAPLAPDGYPIPDRTLRWTDCIRVAGELADMELGPPSKNIIGAHHAARLILSSLSVRNG